MPFAIGGNQLDTGYEVSNSLRFNDDDSPNLQRTFSSGNQTDWTWSGWVKRGNISNNNQVIFGRQNVGDGSNIGKILFTSSDELKLNNKVGASTGFEAVTFAKFRDPSAWYHIWISFDGNQSTHNDRANLYVNGVQFSWNSSSSLSAGNGHINLNLPHAVGFRAGDGGEQYDGYIAEMHFIDGNNSLNHTDFGEFNDNGVWIPKKYTGSYGTNGFYLEFKQTGTSQNSSGIGADTSGNDNHFAVSNLQAIDVTEDTCTNNFATLNPMIRNRYSNSKEPEDGNCAVRFTDTNGNIGKEFSTFGVNSGKWYWEVKVPVVARAYVGVGYMQEMSAFTNPYYDNNPSKGFAINYNGQLEYDSTSTSYGSSLSNNDIVQIALDMDNHLCWFGINGTWQNSATQSEIENSTASNDATTKMGTQQNLNSGEFVFAFVSDPSSSGKASFDINFGNPTFSISSSNNDGKYGNFEYAVPSGYYALCTKRLAEFG